jgi:uncharacterized protein YciI
MPFLIDADDREGAADLRRQIRPDHLVFLTGCETRLLAAGAKLADDGATALGSFYILDTDERADAEAFIAEDPYSKAGLFGSVRITRWRKAFFDFRRQPASGT